MKSLHGILVLLSAGKVVFSRQFILFYYFFKKLIYLAALGLTCGRWDLLMRHTGFSLLVPCGLQSVWAQQLRRVGSLVVARGLSCPTACGILVP